MLFLDLPLLHLLMVVSLVLEKQLLGNQVPGKCYSRDAETGEGALEAVEAGEGARVSPLLTALGISIWRKKDTVGG
jgi:hypothetical protein